MTSKNNNTGILLLLAVVASMVVVLAASGGPPPTKAYAAKDGTTYCVVEPDGNVLACGLPSKEACQSIWQIEGSKCVKEKKAKDDI
jgi:hypothetical protein